MYTNVPPIDMVPGCLKSKVSVRHGKESVSTRPVVYIRNCGRERAKNTWSSRNAASVHARNEHSGLRPVQGDRLQQILTTHFMEGRVFIKLSGQRSYHPLLLSTKSVKDTKQETL